MIATRDDGLHGLEIGEPLQEIEVKRDGILRRIGGIEDIATEQQRVDFLAAQSFNEPVEKGRVFGQSLAFDESGAEVPVCCVKEAHGDRSIDPHRRTHHLQHAAKRCGT